MSQDFSGQNLQGRNFQGQDLAGANFSHADIRGANFQGANLTGANFSHARAGLQRGWLIAYAMLSFVLALGSGMFSLLPSSLAIAPFLPSAQQAGVLPFCGGFILIFAVLILGASRLSLGAGLRLGLVAAIAVAIAETIIAFEAGIVASGMMAFTFFVVGILSLISCFLAILLAAFATNLGATLREGTSATLTAIGTVTGALLSYIVFKYLHFLTVNTEEEEGILFIGCAILATLVAGFGGYLVRRAKGQEKLFVLPMVGGTNFHKADLTDADLTQAKVNFTSFTLANLTRTYFYSATRLG